jgi:hypothetical protein
MFKNNLRLAEERFLLGSDKHTTGSMFRPTILTINPFKNVPKQPDKAQSLLLSSAPE